MATRKKNEVESVLERKGFVRFDKGDHRFFHFFVDGQKVVRTKTSHGKKTTDLGDNLIASMSKQCRLTKKQFFELIDCSMSREQYEKTLRSNDVTDGES
jgi:predicted RNA binding protein YcfA (HicA-like mRNA interferase family)